MVLRAEGFGEVGLGYLDLKAGASRLLGRRVEGPKS